MEKVLGHGVLREGFAINNSIYKLRVPRGNRVEFSYDTSTKTQEINFDSYPISLFRKAYRGSFGQWLASVYGQVMLVHFDEHKPPYPVSYFK